MGARGCGDPRPIAAHRGIRTSSTPPGGPTRGGPLLEDVRVTVRYNVALEERNAGRPGPHMVARTACALHASPAIRASTCARCDARTEANRSWPSRQSRVSRRVPSRLARGPETDSSPFTSIPASSARSRPHPQAVVLGDGTRSPPSSRSAPPSGGPPVLWSETSGMDRQEERGARSA